MSDQLYRLPTDEEMYGFVNGSGSSEVRKHLVVPVEPCEHGKIDRHRRSWLDTLEGGIMNDWCEGAALKGDNNANARSKQVLTKNHLTEDVSQSNDFKENDDE